ncbi:unnamed protein product [Prunus armeniaca]
MADDKKTEGESSSQSQQPHTASMKVEFKPFTNKENFTLWQRRMKHVLAHQNLSVVLACKEKKPETMMDKE